MNKDLQARIESFRNAQGNPQSMALLAVDFLIEMMPEHLVIKKLLEAASIPRWFNEDLLSKVSGLAPNEISPVMDKLVELPFIEKFKSHGLVAYNVHETTRIAIRRRLFAESLTRFRDLSGKAFEYFSGPEQPGGSNAVVEAFYHLFIAEPERAANECERRYADWTNVAGGEFLDLLRVSLEELEKSELVSGGARAEILMVVGWERFKRGETPSLGPLADLALSLAEQSGNKSAIARASCLKGDVAASRGNLKEARGCLLKGTELLAQLPEEHHQRLLVTGLCKLGDCFESEGQTGEALRLYESAHLILSQLSETAGRVMLTSSSLAFIEDRIGRVLNLRGKFSQAVTHLDNAITLCKALNKSSPENLGFQLNLLRTSMHRVSVLRRQGRFSDALEVLNEFRDLAETLERSNPSNVSALSSCALLHLRLGESLQTVGQSAVAMEELFRALGIANKMTALQPEFVEYQRSITTVYTEIALVFSETNDVDRSFDYFTKAFEVSTRMLAHYPGHAWVQFDAISALGNLGTQHAKRKHFAKAINMFKDALSILKTLVRNDPENIEWKRLEAWTFVKIADTRIQMGDFSTALQYHTDALRIDRSVSAMDGENVQARADVGFQLVSLAGALLRNGKKAKAIHALNEAHVILCDLTEVAPSNVQWKTKLAEIEKARSNLGLTPPAEVENGSEA